MTTISGRIPAPAEVHRQVSELRPGRALLLALAGVLFAIGWLIGAIRFGVGWCYVMIRIGFRAAPGAARADAGGPASAG